MNDSIKDLELKLQRFEQEIDFKNALISILSHDSKELFGNFLWLTEAVEHNTISKEEFFNLLPQVKKDAVKNLQTVNDSTSWLKTQYGEFKIQLVTINIFELFQHLEKKYAARLKEKNIYFHFEGDPNSSVQTDQLLLEYIFDKIINNAVKYSFSGQSVYFQYFNQGSQALINVVDGGMGIDERYLPSVFNYGNPVFEGTAGEIGVGLSLKIVKNFVSLMQGTINISSTKNRGTTVSISIPNLKND